MVWVIKSSMLILPSMYQSTIFGMSVRAARAAEGGAAPDAAGDQLERARGDLLSVDQLYKKLTGPILFGRSSPADAATPALEGCKNRGASPCAIRHARVKRPTRNNRAAAWARRTSASSRQ
jgi:hypothetical protein